METPAAFVLSMTAIFILVMLVLGAERLIRAGRPTSVRRVPSAQPARAPQLGIGGRAADLQCVRMKGWMVTRVRVDVRGHSPGTFKLAPAGWAEDVAEMYDDQDLRIGEPLFDRRYIIKARPESHASRIFSVERRAGVIAAVERIARHGSPFINLSKQTLIMGFVGTAQTADADPDLTRSAEDFVSCLLEVERTADILSGWKRGSLPEENARCAARR